MRNFTTPKLVSPFYNYTCLPRKTKKRLKEKLNRYPFLDLNQKLWMILGEENKEYKQFLITEIIRRDNENNN